MIRLTRAQVREVDRVAIEQFHVPGIVLMENAARGVAQIAHAMMAQHPARLLVACGTGNNGGDGLAAARHLLNRGHKLELLLLDKPSAYQADALVNWKIAHAMKIPFTLATSDKIDLRSFDLIIDALFGTGLNRPLEGLARDLVQELSQANAPKLAVDVPSGMDCDTGRVLGDACVAATQTATFVAEKLGFLNPDSVAYTGRVHVVDIGAPAQIIQRVIGA